MVAALLRRAASVAVAALCGAGVVAVPHQAEAQRLRELLQQLFIFGPGQDPLFLAGSATISNPASLQIHGRHYIPSSVAENGSVIGFLSGAIAARASNVPAGATTSGETFRFEGGVPVSTATSAGPVFGERAQTLGRGRILVGLNRTSLSFSSLRGVPLDNVELSFTHENVDFPGCSEQQGGDCKKYGIPNAENDQLKLDLDIDVDVTAFYMSYGLSDRVDLSLVVPVVSASLLGQSNAEIVPFGGTSALHFFAGTPENPVLTASRSVRGSTTGLGDVSARLKINLHQTPRLGAALLLDGRFPTGDEADMLGTGKFVGRAVGVVSSVFGLFSPHLNLGYVRSGAARRNDVLLTTVGFDHLLGRRVTLAADLVGEWQVGSNRLRLPQPVTYEVPFRRSLNPTSIPDTRDDILNGAFGFKFTSLSRFTVVTSALFPLNNGGLRARMIYTLGLEYAY